MLILAVETKLLQASIHAACTVNKPCRPWGWCSASACKRIKGTGTEAHTTLALFRPQDVFHGPSNSKYTVALFMLSLRVGAVQWSKIATWLQLHSISVILNLLFPSCMCFFACWFSTLRDCVNDYFIMFLTMGVDNQVDQDKGIHTSLGYFM